MLYSTTSAQLAHVGIRVSKGRRYLPIRGYDASGVWLKERVTGEMIRHYSD